ncbi:MAG: heavy metal translocating P-type ATPase [Chloroflexota bacterium]
MLSTIQSRVNQVLVDRVYAPKRASHITILVGKNGNHVVDTASSTGLVKRVISRIQAFKQEKINSLFDNNERFKQMQEMSLDEEVLSEEQQLAEQMFKFSSAMVLATAAVVLLYPPLIFLFIPPMIFLQIPFFKEAYQDLRERKISTTVVDATLAVSSLGYTIISPPIMVMGAMAGWVYSFTQKLVTSSKDGTRKKLTNLFGQQPKHVWVLQDGIEVSVPFEAVQMDDLVVIEAGQMVPVDGQIYEGMASIDQHMLTGEAQPAEKGIGEAVFAATVVLAGRIVVQVEKTGAETAAAQVGQILSETSNFTSGVQLRGKEIADRAAGPTLLLSILALPLVGPSRTLAILFSGIGYNMKILGPLSVMNYLQLTSQVGVLIKDGRALEQVSKVDVVVFDKTGTLTQEVPHVGRIFTVAGCDEQRLLAYAAAAEYRQTHPIAKAILQEAETRGLSVPDISDAAYEIGYGIKVRLEEELVWVGSYRFMQMEAISIPDEITAIQQSNHEAGNSLVYVAINEQLAGAIELVPTVRPEAKRIVEYIHQAGLETAIISGDHEQPTRSLASSLGIDYHFAETLPENKADLIEQLQAEGKTVCFVGDGINDSIALQKANVSVSLRGASTIATDTAQIILMDQTLNQLEALFELSKQFESNMYTNLMSTVVPGVIIIGGAFIGWIGYGASIALFSVGLAAGVTNAMRPRFRMIEG